MCLMPTSSRRFTGLACAQASSQNTPTPCHMMHIQEGTTTVCHKQEREYVTADSHDSCTNHSTTTIVASSEQKRSVQAVLHHQQSSHRSGTRQYSAACRRQRAYDCFLGLAPARRQLPNTPKKYNAVAPVMRAIMYVRPLLDPHNPHDNSMTGARQQLVTKCAACETNHLSPCWANQAAVCAHRPLALVLNAQQIIVREVTSKQCPNSECASTHSPSGHERCLNAPRQAHMQCFR